MPATRDKASENGLCRGGRVHVKCLRVVAASKGHDLLTLYDYGTAFEYFTFPVIFKVALIERDVV